MQIAFTLRNQPWGSILVKKTMKNTPFFIIAIGLYVEFLITLINEKNTIICIDIDVWYFDDDMPICLVLSRTYQKDRQTGN